MAPLGPGWLLPSHEGPPPARSRPRRGNATSPSVPEEWPALASQETIGSIQVQTVPFPPPGPGRKEEGAQEEGGVGLPSEVGAGTAETKASLY